MAVPEALLSFLAAQPRGVYQLRQDFTAATSWKINIGQVYQTLQRLARDGFVKPAGQEGNTELYALSEKGAQAIKEWLATSIASACEDRDELSMKILVAAHTGADIATIIQTQRKATLNQIRMLTRAKAGSSSLTEQLLLERQVFALDATARWLDHIEPIAIRIAQEAKKPKSRAYCSRSRALPKPQSHQLVIETPAKEAIK